MRWGLREVREPTGGSYSGHRTLRGGLQIKRRPPPADGKVANALHAEAGTVHVKAGAGLAVVGAGHSRERNHMPSSDYIPRPDADFNTWQSQFSAILSQNIGFWPIDGNLTSAFFDAATAWDTAYSALVESRARAESATRTKDTAREGMERALRPLVKQIQSLLEVTNGDRANLGITVRAMGGGPVMAPTTSPRVQVVGGGRLTHELRVGDESTPTSKAKPKGVLGAEIWLAIVGQDEPMPTDLNAYKYQSLTTRGSVRTTFPSADKGKLAVYMLRWVSTRGDHGPWSDPTPATVAA